MINALVDSGTLGMICWVLTQTVRAVDGETHEDDIRIGIGKGPQAVIVFLTCCVPQCQLHLLHMEVGGYRTPSPSTVLPRSHHPIEKAKPSFLSCPSKNWTG